MILIDEFCDIKRFMKKFREIERQLETVYKVPVFQYGNTVTLDGEMANEIIVLEKPAKKVQMNNLISLFFK